MSIAGSVVQGSGDGGAASSFEVGSEADVRVSNLESNLALNTLNDIIVEGRTVWEMVDQMADAFTDEEGIYLTDGVYIPSSDYYVGGVPDPSTLLIHSDTTNGSQSFVDSSLNSFPLTAFGDAQHTTADSVLGTSSCIIFDGTGDYITTPDNSEFTIGTGDMTIDFWFKAVNSAPGAFQFLVMQGTATSAANFSFYVAIQSTGNQMNYGVSDGTTAYTVSSGSSTITSGAWTHAALIKSGDSLKFYINGVLKTTTALSALFSVANNASVVAIGGTSGGTSLYAGKMSEVRIAKEAKWTSDFTPPTDPYVGSIESNANFSLESISLSASTVPTKARMLFLHDPIDSVTLNTDLVAEVSRDDGTTWSAGTLEQTAQYLSLDVLEANEVDLSGQPVGTSVKWRLTTANTKQQRIHGAVIQCR